MRSRFTRGLCFLVFAMILNSLLGCCVPIASANQIVLTKIAQIETGDAYDVWVDTSSNITYVTCGYSGVKAFDVSDPGNPIEIASVSSSLDYYAHQLVMRNNLMFIGDGRGGLKIINFGNISSPIVLSQYTGDYAWDVEVRGNTAFVANGYSGTGGRLTVVNITDPAAPVLLESFTTVGDATDVEVVENLVFVTTSYKGFTVFDFSNETNPTELAQYVGQLTSDTDMGDIEIVGDLAFLSYWDYNLKVLNISDLSDIRVISEFNESMDAFSVHIDTERNLAFLCDLELGLLLLDIQNPAQITKMTRYFDGGKPNRIEVVGNLVYMTDQENGFVILEIGEISGFTVGPEHFLLVGGLAAVIVLIWWLKKGRSSGHVEKIMRE